MAVTSLSASAASEIPSRAETLIEHPIPGNLPDEQKREIISTKGIEMQHSEERQPEERGLDKIGGSLEKGDKIGSAVVTEQPESDVEQRDDPNADRYLTGYKLFLVFVYAISSSNTVVDANRLVSGMLLSIFLGEEI